MCDSSRYHQALKLSVDTHCHVCDACVAPAPYDSDQRYIRRLEIARCKLQGECYYNDCHICYQADAPWWLLKLSVSTHRHGRDGRVPPAPKSGGAQQQYMRWQAVQDAGCRRCDLRL